jgi:predicted Zn-dependent peptidase
MVFKGTEKRPDPAILTQEIQGVGGMLNAATGRESTNYWVKVPSAHLSRAFDVLADMMRNSVIDAAELDKERGVIFEEIRGIEDTPDDLIHDAIDTLVWGDQAIGRPIIGSEATVAAIDHEQMRQFLRRQYSPERMVIAAAGDVQHAEVVALAEQYFGDLTAGTGDDFAPAEVRQDAPRIQLISRPTQEAHLCVGLPALPYTDDRRYAQGMIDAILSSGMSSRLFQEIRERLGLAYDVYAYFREYADVGQGVVYAGTDPKRVELTINAILSELNKLRREPVPADELARTKELRKGRIVMGLEDSRSVAAWIGGQELVYGEIETPEEVMARIDAVRADEMQALATELIREDRLNLVVVGPFEDDSKLKPLLRL